MTRQKGGDPLGDLWLGWALGSGDLGDSLGRAVAAFKAKPWAGGQTPAVVKARPELAADGLGPVAAALGLTVIPDKTVQAGAIYLGLKGGATGD